jgi:hypothetical protein
VRYYFRQLTWICCALLVVLTLADPGSREISHLAGDLLPLAAVLGIVLGAPKKPAKRLSAGEQQGKARTRTGEHVCGGKAYEFTELCPVHGNLARKKTALEAGAAALARRSQYDDRVADIHARVQAGMMTAAEARNAQAEAAGLLDPSGYAAGRVHGSSPASQVQALGAQYGLSVVTGLKKPGLPVVIVPPASPPSEEELAELRERLTVSLRRREPLVVLPRDAQFDPDPEPEAEPADDYVPAGQDELFAELSRMIRAQFLEHGPAGHYPSLRWFMSPDWLAEVQKLKTATGKSVYASLPNPAGSLYGYRVTTGESFGVPELREP